MPIAQFLLTPVQIKQRILTGIDPTDEQTTKCTNGRLNVLNTLEEDEVLPAAISDLAVPFLLYRSGVDLTAR